MNITDLVRIVKNRFFIAVSKSGNALVLINPFCSRLGYVWRNYIYDMSRYIDFSSTKKIMDDFTNIEARIIAQCHFIEKGLAFDKDYVGFNHSTVKTLLEYLELYLNKKFSLDNEQFVSSIKVLDSYCSVYKVKGYDMRGIEERLAKFRSYMNNSDVGGGVIMKEKTAIIKEAKGNFMQLVNSRHSLRSFGKNKVDSEIILNAIKIAQRSPSVCNRQSSFVYIVDNVELTKKVVTLHGGCIGFGESADKLLVVTSKLRSFFGINERNQAFIDGGIFSMSLIYALHFLGLATCILGWMTVKDKDLRLRQLLPICKDEVVILLILVGEFPQNFKVTSSQRKHLEKIVKIIEK